MSFDLEDIVKTSKFPLQKADQVDLASSRPVELGGPALTHRRGHLPSPYNRGLSLIFSLIEAHIYHISLIIWIHVKDTVTPETLLGDFPSLLLTLQ